MYGIVVACFFVDNEKIPLVSISIAGGSKIHGLKDARQLGVAILSVESLFHPT